MNGAKNKNPSSEQQFCGQKRLVNKRGQRRRARLDKADTVSFESFGLKCSGVPS